LLKLGAESADLAPTGGTRLNFSSADVLDQASINLVHSFRRSTPPLSLTILMQSPPKIAPDSSTRTLTDNASNGRKNGVDKSWAHLVAGAYAFTPSGAAHC
jgi:hypothetical protein